jgi:hypothetical protein
MSGTPTAVTAEDFGPSRHGVHVVSFEDDWGWYAYGHHANRRLLAAINHETRELGVGIELREVMEVDDIEAGVQLRWARNFHINFCQELAWDWCESNTPGAVAITVVHP